MVDGRFFGHFFWKVEGSSAHTRESHTAHMSHGTANVQGGGERGFSGSRTLENSKRLENLKFTLRWQGALSAILNLTNGSHLESKMAAT